MDDYTVLHGKRNKHKEEKDRKYKENSKKRLLTIIDQKFQTTIIGALAAFEEEFGECWGHGLDPNELDEDQVEWREVWIRVRSKILDNGNANKRAAQNEIAQYTLSWDRYVTELPYKGEK